MNLSLFFAPHPTSYTPPANGRGPSAPAASAKSTFSYLGLVSARYNRSASPKLDGLLWGMSRFPRVAP